ncbi:ribonuclease HII [Heliorestis acidaminivorans]|uniref:Ribonuclease HII n=1 Tax=Heliorestis acidaminivorans TaxID=553427 RepID=A0A6I0F4F9_9FIRM|nr:ribonuclease HII [Heliorestis acidaminivorans]KAB2954423.1 ribonuclease HII [Heliorestis acidaminivorans]
MEKNLRQSGHNLLAGVDEVGRGPLAGPVVAAAVILPPYCYIDGLADSKKVSSSKREKLAQEIAEKAIALSVTVISARHIDQQGIVPSTFKAMNRAVEHLKLTPDYVLVDGNKVIPTYQGQQSSLVGGDGLAAPIAAASIIAKVFRDNQMIRFSRIFAEYGFEKHKGYGTAEHRKILSQVGPSPIHRHSFLPK